jgi:hypothetical protein
MWCVDINLCLSSNRKIDPRVDRFSNWNRNEQAFSELGRRGAGPPRRKCPKQWLGS